MSEVRTGAGVSIALHLLGVFSYVGSFLVAVAWWLGLPSLTWVDAVPAIFAGLVIGALLFAGAFMVTQIAIAMSMLDRIRQDLSDVQRAAAEWRNRKD